MEITDKVIDNIMSIIKVSGFYITSYGDPSVGMFDATWELKNDFYFDSHEELEQFRDDLKMTFENYCGEVSIVTFEEKQLRYESESHE